MAYPTSARSERHCEHNPTESYSIAGSIAHDRSKPIAISQSLADPIADAFDLEGNPVELRVSRCRTENVHYLSELR